MSRIRLLTKHRQDMSYMTGPQCYSLRECYRLYYAGRDGVYELDKWPDPQDQPKLNSATAVAAVAFSPLAWLIGRRRKVGGL